MTTRAHSGTAPRHAPVTGIAVAVATVDEVVRIHADPYRQSPFSELEHEQAAHSGDADRWLCRVLAIKRAVTKVLGGCESAGDLPAVEAATGPEDRWIPRTEGDLELLAISKGVREFAVSVEMDNNVAATATVIAISQG